MVIDQGRLIFDGLLADLTRRYADELDQIRAQGLFKAERIITSPQSAEITLADDERQRCEVWTRVMGYHRPVASFNIGKKGEHCERRFFAEERAQPHF